MKTGSGSVPWWLSLVEIGAAWDFSTRDKLELDAWISPVGMAGKAETLLKETFLRRFQRSVVSLANCSWRFPRFRISGCMFSRLSDPLLVGRILTTPEAFGICSLSAFWLFIWPCCGLSTSRSPRTGFTSSCTASVSFSVIPAINGMRAPAHTNSPKRKSLQIYHMQDKRQ